MFHHVELLPPLPLRLSYYSLDYSIIQQSYELFLS